MFENPFKKEFDESILTEHIFSHCKNVYDYDECISCQIVTYLLLIITREKDKIN